MKKSATIIFFLALAVALVIILTDLPFWANAEPPESKTTEMAKSAMQGISGMNNDAASQAGQAMDGNMNMDMGPHMKMTTLRPLQPGDQEKAQQIVEEARKVAEKYEDYRVALASGFHIFLPNVPQKQYHFNNYDYAHEAVEHFNPDHPTSLLYEKHGNGYTLVGVMYTAPKWSTEDELNQRIPLSIAHWHTHVNLCMAPAQPDQKPGTHDARFGFNGSISTEADCVAAGGHFVPRIFGWMVHVYPFEEKSADIWSVERQHAQE